MPSTVISERLGRVRVACVRIARLHMACLRPARPRPGLLAGLAILMCLCVAPASQAGSGLDPKTAAAGLKEALGVGTSRSVDLLGRQDGYLKNVDVRIPMPEKLHTLFRPIVGQQLDKVGTTRSLDAMMNRAASLPFAGKSAFDLNAYVTGKALDGMFLMIGREEEKIRKDPVARTTDLLKTVFGAAGESGKKKSPWWKKAAASSAPRKPSLHACSPPALGV